MMVVFDPRFEIMPGTKGASPKADLNTYEVGLVKFEGERCDDGLRRRQ